MENVIATCRYDRPCTVRLYNEITEDGIKYYVKVFDSHTYEVLTLEVFNNENDAQKFYDSIN